MSFERRAFSFGFDKHLPLKHLVRAGFGVWVEPSLLVMNRKDRLHHIHITLRGLAILNRKVMRYSERSFLGLSKLSSFLARKHLG